MWKAELSLKRQIFTKFKFPLPEDYEDLQKLLAGQILSYVPSLVYVLAEVCVNGDILESSKM